MMLIVTSSLTQNMNVRYVVLENLDCRDTFDTLIISRSASFSAVLQSYQKQGRTKTKACVMESRFRCEKFRRRDFNPGLLALNRLCCRGSFIVKSEPRLMHVV